MRKVSVLPALVKIFSKLSFSENHWPVEVHKALITTKYVLWRLLLKLHSDIGGDSSVSFGISYKKQKQFARLIWEYDMLRPTVVSLRNHGLEPLQIECLREIWISKGWYNFNNNKIVYLKIATETTFWDRWWKQDVVSCFLQKKKAVNKSNLDMSNDGSNTLRHVSALLVLIYLVYTTLI